MDGEEICQRVVKLAGAGKVGRQETLNTMKY